MTCPRSRAAANDWPEEMALSTIIDTSPQSSMRNDGPRCQITVLSRTLGAGIVMCWPASRQSLPSWTAAAAEDWLGKTAMNLMLIEVATGAPSGCRRDLSRASMVRHVEVDRLRPVRRAVAAAIEGLARERHLQARCARHSNGSRRCFVRPSPVLGSTTPHLRQFECPEQRSRSAPSWRLGMLDCRARLSQPQHCRTRLRPCAGGPQPRRFLLGSHEPRCARIAGPESFAYLARASGFFTD